MTTEYVQAIMMLVHQFIDGLITQDEMAQGILEILRRDNEKNKPA